MGEIHKLTKDGKTLFPATTTDAVAHPQTRTALSNLIHEFNVSELFPKTEGYTLESAINILNSKSINITQGTKVMFLDEDNNFQEWVFSGSEPTNTSSWFRLDSWYTETEDYTDNLEANLITDALRKTEQNLSDAEVTQVKKNLKIPEAVVKVTWAELKVLKENSKLVPGQYYRIYNFKTTTGQENTKSANHQFDIIIEALTKNELIEEAKVCQHEGDTYFSNTALEAWEIKYCLENDTNRFAWANNSGYGVIYYMKDEWNNEAWYDFKNIQFKRNCSESKYSWIGLTGDKHFYTFSRIDSGVVVDDSLGTGAYPSSDNHLGRSTEKITKLNGTIFIGNGTSANFIEDGHKDNTFGEGTKLNKIGHYFIGNTISGIFQENNVGPNFTKNTIYKFTKNTVLGECSENIFPKIFNQNKIGSGFKNNSFKVGNGTTDTVNNNEFGNNISYVRNLPASFEKVNILNNTLDYTENIDANQIILFDNKNLYNLIISLDDKNNTEEECGIEISKYEGKLIYTLKSTACTYNLGEFNTSGDAENEAKNNVKISYNKEINIIKYSVTGSAPGQGLILQQVGNLKTTQYLFWDGNTYKRTIRFTNSGGNITIDSGNTTGWAKVLNITGIEYNNSKIQLKDGSDVVSEVTIPEATSTTPGLMSVNDKNNINKISDSIYDLGNCSNWNDMLSKAAAKEVSGNQNIRLIYFTINAWGKCGVIEQQVGERSEGKYGKTLQTLKWDNCESVRYLKYNQSSGDVEDGYLNFNMRRTMPTEIYYKPGEKKLSFRQKDNDDSYVQGLDNNADFGTVELPIATNNNYSVVKLDSDYTKNTEGTALSLEGAKNLSEAIDGKFKLLNNKIEQKHDDLKVQTLEEIFYSDLVTKRNNGELVPGQKYRILDYACSTNSGITDISSAGHSFDIIVEAISKNKLSENAKACISENKVNIFTSNDIGNWEDATELAPDEVKNIATSGSISTQQCTTGLAKSGDTITVEFTGIYKNNELIQGLGVTLSLEGSDEILVSDYGKKEIYSLNVPQDIAEGTNIVIKFYIDSNITNAIDGICGVKILKKSTDSYFSSNNLSAWELKYSIDKRDFNWPDTSNFKGVIYYLKDEYDNECSYDFKNILFNGYYTFSYIIDDVIYDGSVKYKHCYGNKIKPSYNYGTYILGKNIFKNTSETAQCVFNELLEGCEDNVFGNNCSSNKLGNYCKNNTFGYDCQYNTFDSFCQFNTFGNKCQSNTFGVQCQNNTFGSYILRVNFGKQCLNNKLTDGNGNNLSACRMITFGDQCNGVNLYTTAGPSFDNGKWLQNIKVNNGLSGNIEIENLNTSYSLLITKDKDGNIVKCIEGSSVAELTKNITYSDLKTLRDNNELVPGQKYRITDYVTTSSIAFTLSAGHQFDLIVEALTPNTLSEVASACLHEGDTYFSNAGAKLEAWKIWYCLDNDTERFTWAGSSDSKGVIYRMIDEWNNECPYDFKNIMFTRCKIDGNFTGIVEGSRSGLSNKIIETLQDIYSKGYINFIYSGNPNSNNSKFDNGGYITCGLIKEDTKTFYTFTKIDSNGDIHDSSLFGGTICNKHESKYVSNYSTRKVTIQPIILIALGDNCKISYNEFKGNLGAIQLLCLEGNSINYNIFLDNSVYNYLVNPISNIIKNSKYLFSSKNLQKTEFISNDNFYSKDNVVALYIRDSKYNCFGNDCNQIHLLEVNNYNIFGNNSMSVTLESNSSTNVFGNNIENIHLFENVDEFGIYSDENCTIPKDYIRQMQVRGEGRLKLYNTEEVGKNNCLRNLDINCTSLDGKRELIMPTNTGYLTKVASNSKGEMKVYCEADLIQ